LSTSPLKIYIIVFTADQVNLAALVQYLHDSVDVAAYWNYIPLVFCIKSNLGADALLDKLTPFFPSNNFMIAEINDSNTQGILPEGAWDWFSLEHHQKVRPPTLTPFTAYTQPLLPLLKDNKKH
jgi:hypothetical protein